MVTPDEVMNVTFRTVRLSSGYDIDQVDDFLDLVVATLRGEAAPGQQLDAAAIDAVRFTPTRFMEGYRRDEVDALLARVRETLAERSDGSLGG